jgi:hypothetical protein
MAATSRRGASRSPFHWLKLAGQAVHIAFCGAHSGATEIGLSVTETVMASFYGVPVTPSKRQSIEIMAVCQRHQDAPPMQAVIGGANPKW